MRLERRRFRNGPRVKASVYTRPDKPLSLYVSRRPRVDESLPEPEQPVAVHCTTECHVTPPDIAARMVDYLGPVGDFLTLEPSAGTGNLLAALFESGHSDCETVAIERSQELCQAIRQRSPMHGQYVNPIRADFLEWASERPAGLFPRIVMNPPFKAIRKHMDAALRMLGPSGHDSAVFVALVPSTYEHPKMEHLESLGPDTFSSAKVNTKIVRFTL